LAAEWRFCTMKGMKDMKVFVSEPFLLFMLFMPPW
jgi:hypothetical protein